MKTVALLSLAALLWLAAGADSVDRSADEIVARSPIEARGRSHGEVRLVRRGSGVVVQTLLVTRTLKRAAGRIREKEAANWPEGSRGYGASQVYAKALEAAVAEVLAAERSDRHRRLLIEIALSDNAGCIVLSKPSTQDGPDGITLVASQLITRLELPCSWTRREIELVAEDRGLDLLELAPLPACAAP